MANQRRRDSKLSSTDDSVSQGPSKSCSPEMASEHHKLGAASIQCDEVAAYHEAGHCVVAMHLGLKVTKISIRPNYKTGARGEVTIRRPRGLKERLEFCDPNDKHTQFMFQRMILFALGGIASEEEYRKRSTRKGSTCKGSTREGWDGDNDKAAEHARRICLRDNELNPLLQWLRLRARAIVRNPLNKVRIRNLAKALIDKKELSVSEAESIFLETIRELI